jgi:hypothetical protein
MLNMLLKTGRRQFHRLTVKQRPMTLAALRPIAQPGGRNTVDRFAVWTNQVG